MSKNNEEMILNLIAIQIIITFPINKRWYSFTEFIIQLNKRVKVTRWSYHNLYYIDYISVMFAILRFLLLKLNERHYICAAEYCQEMN